MRKRTSTEQSYEPLVTPESWKGDELRFSVRLTQILDGLFARLRAMRTELAGKLGKTEQAADSAQLGGVPAGSFALKTDTAPDTEKLGGKSPEYYLTPYNYLVNSNFVNPAKHEGTALIDRWETNMGANLTLVAGNGKTTLKKAASAGVFYQTLPVDLAGKTMTYAVKTANGITCRSTAISSASVFAQIDGLKAYLGVTSSNGSTTFRIYFNDQSSIEMDIFWFALYEGSYTADTLPPYVPAHPRVESLKIGNPVQPVNLLDNGNWHPEKIIAQAGICGTHGTTTYACDRWITNGTTDIITQGTQGLAINGSCDIKQMLPNASTLYNKRFTICVETSAGNTVKDFAMGNWAGGVTLFDELKFYSIPSASVLLRVNGSIEIYKVALYEGKYTAETLPPYVPKPYAVELAECMRYAYVIGTDKWLFGSQVAGAGIMVPITISTAMRKTPSAIGVGTWQAFVNNVGWVDLTFWSVTYNVQTGFVHGIVFAGLEEYGVNAGDTVIVRGIDGLYCDL